MGLIQRIIARIKARRNARNNPPPQGQFYLGGGIGIGGGGLQSRRPPSQPSFFPSSRGGTSSNTSKTNSKKRGGRSSSIALTPTELKKINSKSNGNSSIIQKLIRQRIRQKMQGEINRLKKMQGEINRLKKIPIRVYPKVKKGYNVITGGSVTQRELRKEDEEINKEVEKFNKKYEGKELSEKEYKEYEKEKAKIEEKEKNLKSKRIKFEKSPLRKIGKFFYGDEEALIIPTERNINYYEKQVKKFNEKISKKKNKGRKTKFEETELKKYKKILNNLKKGEIEKGTPLLAIEGPAITPVGTAGAITKATRIKFVGKQTRKGNEIITDILFETGKGKRIGYAKGVTLQKGKRGYTIIAGRSGRLGFTKNLKAKVKGVKTFVGREKSVTFPSKAKIKQIIKLSKGRKNKIIVDKNIKVLKNVGIGEVASTKGKSLYNTAVKFPSPKIIKVKKKGINQDFFSTISSSLTKGDLSKIIGRTITAKGRKAKFIGIIKGDSKATKSVLASGGKATKLQYKKALERVIGTISSAEAKANKLNIKGKTILGIATTNIIKKAIKNSNRRGGTIQQSLKKIKPSSKNLVQEIIQKNKTKTKNTQSTMQKVGEKLRTRQKQKSRQRTKSKVTPTLTTKQKTGQKQKSRQKTTQKQQLKQQGIATPSFFVPRKIKKITPLHIRRRSRKSSKRITLKSQPAFNVYGKSGKKFIKINKKPLSKKDALAKGSSAVDNTTSRQFKIVPIGFKKQLGKVRKSESNYFNRRGYKFRQYKLKKGTKYEIKPKYIEKTRYVIDTKGEKKGLSLAKYLAKKRRGGTIRKTKRKATPKQLKNLAKARRILAKKRNGRR